MVGLLLIYASSLPDAVIYEANLRAEGPKVGFAALTKRLNSISQLGVNVLWLMPVQPVGKVRSAGGLGSPYATADYDAINPEFGTEADFRTLVSEAHKLKMRVLIDWVANHTAWDNPWIKTHPDWYKHDTNGRITNPAGTNWNDVAALDYRNVAMKSTMIKSMRGWIKRFDLDGLRCDTADFVPFEFWKEAVPKVRAASSRPLLMLAEGYRADHYSAGFDLTYGWPFFDKLCAIYRGAKASELAAAAAAESKHIPAGAQRLRFITNHDKSAWEGSLVEFYKTLQGIKTATVITTLYGGTPLIYEGQEVAYAARIPIFDHSTIDWNRDKTTRIWISQLLKIRRDHAAFRSGDLKDISDSDTVAFVRQSGSDEVLVVANVRGNSTTFQVPKGTQGDWREAFSNEPSNVSANLTLQPYEYRIYYRRPTTTQ